MGLAELQTKLQDKNRLSAAEQNPLRAPSNDPLDHRLGDQLGRILLRGLINRQQYEAGHRWGEVYHQYLRCIGAPSLSGFSDALQSDDECERWTMLFRHGRKVLEEKGKRVFHAVNQIAVYEEPEEYGDSDFRIEAAKIGLTALAEKL